MRGRLRQLPRTANTRSDTARTTAANHVGSLVDYCATHLGRLSDLSPAHPLTWGNPYRPGGRVVVPDWGLRDAPWFSEPYMAMSRYARIRGGPDIVAAACAYECAALISGRMPSITSLQSRHRLIAVAVVGWLAVHFYRARVS